MPNRDRKPCPFPSDRKPRPFHPRAREPRPVLGLLAPALGLAFLLSAPTAGTAQVDPARAEAWFAEARALCEAEGGELWGVLLCGPMAISDAATGTLATSRPEPEGPRPRVLGYANAPWEWGERRWAFYVWDFLASRDSRGRARVLLHELFHVVQPELGLFIEVAPGENEHLETAWGRYWLQLEWRALARALASSGAERREAVRDALAFRRARRDRFPGAAEPERIAEINEGLAQYTATVVAAPSREEAVADAGRQLLEAPEDPSFVRTFGYPGGTAWGLLLDDYAPGWRREITTADDLGELVATAAALEPAEDPEAAALAYGGEALLRAEEEREAEREARVARLRERFVEGPVLVVPRGRNASFVTLGVTPVPGAGTLYPTYRVQGPWGTLEADRVLVSPDGSTLRLPAPVTVEGDRVSGKGWSVRLAHGWEIRPGPRPGDRQVVPASGAPDEPGAGPADPARPAPDPGHPPPP